MSRGGARRWRPGRAGPGLSYGATLRAARRRGRPFGVLRAPHLGPPCRVWGCFPFPHVDTQLLPCSDTGTSVSPVSRTLHVALFAFSLQLFAQNSLARGCFNELLQTGFHFLSVSTDSQESTQAQRQSIYHLPPSFPSHKHKGHVLTGFRFTLHNTTPNSVKYILL